MFRFQLRYFSQKCLKKSANCTCVNPLTPSAFKFNHFIKSLAQLELDESYAMKFCTEAVIWKVKTETLYFSSSNKVGQA